MKSLMKQIIKNSDQIAGIRKSSAIVGEILRTIGREITAGMKTKDLEDIAVSIIKKYNAKSAFYHYGGKRNPYPGQICISVNDEVVHGIPGEKVIRDGDIVSVDVGVVLDGYYGDAARTFVIGDISERTKELISTTQEALSVAVSLCNESNTLRDISLAIYKTAQDKKIGVVRDLVGHGVGLELHEPPQIPNFVIGGPTIRLRKGMVLAIEPMFTEGDYRVTYDRHDGWTVRTMDGSLSAHFENTILVGEEHGEILTKAEDDGK